MYSALQLPLPLGQVMVWSNMRTGHNTVEKSATFEVLLRRLHAIRLADKQGNWEQANIMEEVPSEKTPELHEVIVTKLMKTHQLMVQAENVKAKGPSANDDE